MTQSKHTPGPWHVINRPSVAKCGIPWVRAGNDDHYLFYANLSGGYNGCEGHEKAMADGRLIAAAPELLEVLEMYQNPTNDLREVSVRTLLATKARAAIAKAKGS